MEMKEEESGIGIREKIILRCRRSKLAVSP